MLRNKLIWLFSIVTFYCVFQVIFQQAVVREALRSFSTHLQSSVTRKWLEYDHIFVYASDPDIELIGRWQSSTDRLDAQAAFSGSRVRFAIQNSTSLLISTDCASYVVADPEPPYGELEYGTAASTAIHVLESSSTSMIVFIDNQTQLFQHGGEKILSVAQNLTTTESHGVEILFHTPGLGTNTKFCFGGIWLSKGGSLVTTITDGARSGQASALYDDEFMNALYDRLHAERQRKPVLEAVTSTSTLAQAMNDTNPGTSIYQASWTALLEASNLFNITVSPLPVPEYLCLTPKCQPNFSPEPLVPTIADMFFRSGPPNHSLFHSHWFWPTRDNPPRHFIFDIGLTDFYHFLASQPSDHPVSKHTLDAFTAHFVTAYVDFILTIRRTSWREDFPFQDPIFAYTSAPSNLSIFIMTPLLPSTFPSYLTNTIHTALRRVTSHLRTHEGDIHTHLIDTSGWLDSSDFLAPSNPPTDPARIIPPLPILDAKAHRKIAYFLSLYLCPYFAHDPDTCDFDRHDEYVGNLYVPEEVGLGRMMEERKIERVKALVGGFD